jgi:nonribosomal peptide synthetase protein BlmVI
LATDLWSLGLLFDDVAARYPDDGITAPIVDRYPAYVADQERYLRSAAASERDDYLRRLIPAGHPPLDIRTDRPRGPRRDPRAARVRAILPADVCTALAERDQVALLTALWGVCLHRYGAPGPVVVGVPVAGRPSGSHATIGGLCTNTVPLAITVDPAEPLDALAGATRAQLLAGVGAGIYPLARAVKVLRPARVAGRMPLVETLVVVQESPVHRAPDLMAALADGDWVNLGELRLRPIEVPRRTCRYDLDLVVTPRPRGGYLVTLDYAAHLFDQGTAEGILATYTAMVAAAATGRTVADTFVLPPEQRAHYDLAGRPGGRREVPVSDHPDQVLAADLLTGVATETPHNLAVSDGAIEIDFAEFTARVDRLAAVLAEAGDAR